MEEQQPSWKGHGFTLVVFAGIVVLCAIFFVLGMTVGRGQGQRSAQAALNAAAAKAAAADARDRANDEPGPAPGSGKVVTFVPEPASEPVKAAPPPPALPDVSIAPAKPGKKTPPAEAPVLPPEPPKGRYLQIFALEKSATAHKEMDNLRKKGFSAIILEPDAKNKLYRVQVGPFSNTADLDDAKRKLEALGLTPIKK